MKLTKDKVIKQLTYANGNLSAAATALGVARKTVYEAIERWDLQDTLDDCREHMGDIAEGVLEKLIKQQSLGATTFYLKTQHKRRGYVERQESTGADGGPIQTQTVDPMPRSATLKDWVSNRQVVQEALAEMEEEDATES